MQLENGRWHSMTQAHRHAHAEVFQDSHDAMRSLMWHKDPSACALVVAIVNEAQTA